MWIRNLWLLLVGLGAGGTVAGGVFTIFTAVGLVPRFADRTHSADRIIRYETMIIWGCLFGTLFSLFGHIMIEAGWSLAFLGNGFLAIAGLFFGAYVGTLAISIAELLEAIPIMLHRVKLKKGIRLILFSFALGKLMGALFYYMVGVYEW